MPSDDSRDDIGLPTKANEDLAHAARIATLGELMASITHEINQPLAAIVTDGNAALRWLRRPQPDPGEASASIERMIGEAQRASEIIARTRKLATKGSGERTAFDVGAMIDEAVAITRPRLSALGAGIVSHLPTHLPAIVADRIQIQQVVINLIMNAAQAMADAVSPNRDIRLRVASHEDDLMFAVTDTGPGIAAADRERLFDAFFTTRAEGMGMGLSVARTIVEAHGGHISLLSTDASGTTFRFTIPIAAD